VIVRSHLNGDIALDSSVSLTHATISGKVTLANFAQIAHSTVDNPAATTRTIIRDFATVVDNSHVLVPIEIKDHAVVVRSTLSRFSSRNDATLTVVIDQSLILSRWDCQTIENFEALLTAARLNRNQPVAAPTIAPAVASGSQAPRMPIGDESNRRVMRLQGVTS
jgi:hypothetical protein